MAHVENPMLHHPRDSLCTIGKYNRLSHIWHGITDGVIVTDGTMVTDGVAVGASPPFTHCHVSLKETWAQ